jgi:hypothetical protein
MLIAGCALPQSSQPNLYAGVTAGQVMPAHLHKPQPLNCGTPPPGAFKICPVPHALVMKVEPLPVILIPSVEIVQLPPPDN